MRKSSHHFATLLQALLLLATPAMAGPPLLSDGTSLDILRKGVEERPEARRDATVTFGEPLDLRQLAGWLDARQLEPLSARGSFSFADQTMTVFFGDLASYQGSITEILETQIEAYYPAFLDDAIADLTEKAQRHDLPTEETAMAERYALGLEAARGQAIEWRSIDVIGSYRELASLADDPAVWVVQVNETNRAPFVDGFWNQPGRQKLALSEIARVAAEGTPQATSGGARSAQQDDAHTRAATLCGPPLAPSEANCPPDRNWLPDAPFWYAFFEQLQTFPPYTRGIAYSQNQWSSTELQAYKNIGLPHCNPVVSGPDAPCKDGLFGDPQEDVIYVPRATYESEVAIPNPLCVFRTGVASVDRLQGCFAAYFAASSLPSAYLDTTLFDDSDSYSATIGSASGVALTAGALYVSYQYFDAFLQDLTTLLFRTVDIRGQIGTRVDSLCFLGIANCVFGVDTTKIDDAKILPVL